MSSRFITAPLPCLLDLPTFPPSHLPTFYRPSTLDPLPCLSTLDPRPFGEPYFQQEGDDSIIELQAGIILK